MCFTKLMFVQGTCFTFWCAVSQVYEVTDRSTNIQYMVHIWSCTLQRVYIHRETGMNQYGCGAWRQWKYLQSQGLPSHVFKQSRGWGERALWTFLQRQRDTCRVPTQQIHQVLQLPAHLVSDRTMRFSSTHRNNTLMFEHRISSWCLKQIGMTFLFYPHYTEILLWSRRVETAVQAAASHVDEDVKCKTGCQGASCTPPVTSTCRRCHVVISSDVVCCEQLHAL